MQFKEYECSFEVNNFAPILEFCNKNGFNLIEQNKQIRTIYKDKDKRFMFRTTINESDNKITKKFDFKEDKLVPGQIFGERQETLEIKYENEDEAQSIVEFFNMTKETVLIRIRQVFLKNDVKFELDEYIEPRIACVVGIEGKKEEVDNMYNILKTYQI
ncbi:MAG: hypothetical protein IJ301_02720 [Clostridia bacterium]|nr:hypothetical protein [Clostridia bacterium]